MIDEDKINSGKSMHEKIIDSIADSIKTSTVLYIQGREIEAYRALKDIYYKIYPFNFQDKEKLLLYTQEINNYIDNIENTGGKPDRSKLIIINNKKYELKKLIEEYWKIIPTCLYELNLWLEIKKQVDDNDLRFGQETFNTNESLVFHKKKELMNVSTENIIKCLTINQIHDVHSRLMTYPDKKGMKRLPYEEEKKNE